MQQKLEEWSLTRKQKEPNAARLKGKIYGSPHHPDGTEIVTAKLVAVDWKNRRATVAAPNEIVLQLGSPDPEWVHWLGTRGVKLDDIMAKEWSH